MIMEPMELKIKTFTKGAENSSSSSKDDNSKFNPNKQRD